jgi:hypothetical protein
MALSTSAMYAVETLGYGAMRIGVVPGSAQEFNPELAIRRSAQ